MKSSFTQPNLHNNDFCRLKLNEIIIEQFNSPLECNEWRNQKAFHKSLLQKKENMQINTRDVISDKLIYSL